MKITDTLFLIPARGGSKGLPRKNILPIGGKPMIYYSIDAARGVTNDENICVSTDDLEIIQVVEDYGLKVQFIRPAKLATDIAGSSEVIQHAIDFYKNSLNKNYSKICLLQPTSPLRTTTHIFGAFNLWNDGLDMVVSVKESKVSPFYNLFDEDKFGYLKKFEVGTYFRRQDAPQFWEFNGAIYIISIAALSIKPMHEFTKIRKYVMEELSSHDIDTFLDLIVAESIISNCLIKLPE